MGGEVNGLSRDRLNIGHPFFGEREVLFGGGALGSDPVLLHLEVIDRDRVGIERLEELLPLAFEFLDSDALSPAFPLVVFAHSSERGQEARANLARLLGAQLDALPVLGDGFLDGLGWEVALLASLADDASDTREVGVGAAVAPGSDVREAMAAAGAVERPLQVVLVLAVLLAGVGVG